MIPTAGATTGVRPAVALLDDSAATALREDLVDAHFTIDALRDLWGFDADAALSRNQREPARRALVDRQRDPSRVAGSVLARAFVLGFPVTDAELAAALPRTGVDGAVALGLMVRSGSVLAPAVDLRPYGFTDARGEVVWFVASDLGELALGHPLEADHVLGIGGATSTLAGIQSQRPVGSVLDLGTGCGIQALHASRYADRVVATDISVRALQFARFTATLNGIDTIEFRHGDLFDPAAGEQFDVIVSNPPFVITPRAAGVPAYEYRDGGRIGDALVADVVAGIGRHLVPGGRARLLGNWEDRSEAAIADPARRGIDRAAEWVRRAGLAGWILERDHLDPAFYAETWIRDAGTLPGTPEFDRLYAAWLDDFAERGVAGVGFGYLLLREPSPALSAGTVRTERIMSLGTGGGIGEHLDTCEDGIDRIAPLDDEALALLTFRVAPDVTEDRSHRPGAEDPEVILLSQAGAFGRRIPVDTALAAVVGACDGDLPLGVLCGAVADLLGADPVALGRSVLPRVRELVAGGMLLIA